MKICFLITGLGIGGAEKHLFNLVPRLKFNVFIISLSNNNDFGVKIEQKGIKVYYLGLNKINLPLVIWRFKKIIKKERPDIIDTYLIHSNIFGRIFGKIFGIKKIISSVRNDYTSLKLLSFIDRITQCFVSLYILNSKALLFYANKKCKVPKEELEIITNGIDLESLYNQVDKKYNIRNKLNLKNEDFIAVTIARLLKQKDISTLIQAIKYINKNIHLIIVGDGPEKKNLINLSRKLNLSDRIFFLGTRYDVPNILYSSNVFILPSIREGMSNALLEAMALKKCCIVSDIAPNIELIQDGFNGMVFKTSNKRHLAEVIEKVYNTPNLKIIEQEAYNTINKKYRINNTIKKYERIIEKLYNK